MNMCMRVCECACVRACVCACMCVCQHVKGSGQPACSADVRGVQSTPRGVCHQWDTCVWGVCEGFPTFGMCTVHVRVAWRARAVECPHAAWHGIGVVAPLQTVHARQGMDVGARSEVCRCAAKNSRMRPTM